MTLFIRPISLKAANQYVRDVHRHHGPTTGHKFSISVVDEGGEIRGVAIAGRPVARHLDDGDTLEVIRLATDGARNACSMLYSAIRRAAIAMGYKPHRIFTYILESESGASLRAAGWIDDGPAGGGSWNRGARQREDKHPTEPKRRFIAGPRPQEEAA